MKKNLLTFSSLALASCLRIPIPDDYNKDKNKVVTPKPQVTPVKPPVALPTLLPTPSPTPLTPIMLIKVTNPSGIVKIKEPFNVQVKGVQGPIMLYADSYYLVTMGWNGKEGFYDQKIVLNDFGKRKLIAKVNGKEILSKEISVFK